MNWDQMKAILWLRWRLTANQLRRSGQSNTVLTVIGIGLLLLGSVGLAIGGLFAGLAMGTKAPPLILLLAWDGVMFVFLIFWINGVLLELQRSESIDISKMLHLPITLPQVFALNYLASHFSPMQVLFVPFFATICTGLTLGGGLRMALAFPLVFAFLFMLTALTYCLRGWLSALMVNKRKRRSIMVWITISIVLMGQLPNLLFQSSFFRTYTHSAPGQSGIAANKDGSLGLPPAFVKAHAFVPPGWLGLGTMRLKEGDIWPALAATLASSAIALIALARAFRLTMRFYQSAEGGNSTQAATPPPPASTSPRGILLVERRLSWLPDDIAALFLATLRALLRAPELKMALLMPIIVGVMVMAFSLSKGSSLRTSAAPPFAPTFTILIACFSISTTLCNQFGLDRNGFRSLVLLPTERYRILAGKNLAFAPLVGGIGLVLLTIVAFVIRPPWNALATALLQLSTSFFMMCIVGNTLSIFFPYRMASGSLKAQKPKAMTMLATILTLFLLPLIICPILIPPAAQYLFTKNEWLPGLPIDLISGLCMMGIVAAIYKVLLPLQGRWLQSHEQKILLEVTEETE